jgi:hypothetical protein
MLLTSFITGSDNPDDEFAENSSEILDRVEDAEPAEDEGEKMAQRIWDKVMEQLPAEAHSGSVLDPKHDQKCRCGA